MPEHSFIVEDTDDGARVDVVAVRNLPDEVPSRMFVKRIIDDGRLTVNGKPVKAQHKVRSGDSVVVDISGQDYPDEKIRPEDVPLDILWDDEDLVAINKPIGMAVHPAAGNYGGTLVNALVHHFIALSDVNGLKRPGIVHRLDKETSGVILVAKNNVAHARLARQFEKHTLQKEYLALVEGEVQFDEGCINAEIGDHRKYHDMRRIVPDGEGKPCETMYRVIRRSGKVSAVALFPKTGRTHQLRLHMRHIGHPILGDDKYGQKGNFTRLALHARAISFDHPRTKRLMTLSVPVPVEFKEYLGA